MGPGSDEDAPRRPPRRDTEELDNDTYGPLKVACEDDVIAWHGARATIVRPGKVADPHDWQDGLTYWVRRAARGGRVALPGDPGQPVQVVPVPPATVPRFPLVRTNWPAQQRSPARARAAGLPATPLAVTVADVLAWDMERGAPPLAGGFTPEQERALVSQQGGTQIIG